MTGRTWTVMVLLSIAVTGCRKSEPMAQRAAMSPSDAIRPPTLMIYPWSIVAGGIDSQVAMQRAIEDDPIVKAHYAGLDPTAFWAGKLAAKRQGYVSFRIRDKVYWTRRMVTLEAGETVLTDGKSIIRGRCGNLFSLTPREPVAPPAIEPPEIAMNRSALHAQLNESPAFPGEPSVATADFQNPKVLGPRRAAGELLPLPSSQAPLSAGWMPARFPGPGGALAAAGGKGTPTTPTATTPAPTGPELPLTNPPIGASLTPPLRLDLPPPAALQQPLVLAQLVIPQEKPYLPAGKPFPSLPWTPPPANRPLPIFPPLNQPPLSITPPFDSPPAFTNPPPTGPPPATAPPADPAPPRSPEPSPPDPPEASVPEPGSWVLLLLGVAAIAVGSIRRKP